MKEVPIENKCCLTVEEFAANSNIRTKKLREIIKQPNCDFALAVGTKTLIKRKEFEKFISFHSVL